MRILRPVLYMLFMGAACTGTSEYHRTSGFIGVRGKRSILQEESTTEKEGEIVKNEKETNLEIQKRASPELTAAEEDKPFNGWIQDSNFQEGIFKRAPSSSFFGMRGKKYFYDEWPDKRAKLTNNFFGMRGKKQLTYPPFPNNLQYATDKRLAPAGFMGMRGKKPYGQEDMTEQNDISDYMDTVDDKRAPKYSASFFGMRGKKGDDDILDNEVDMDSEELMGEAEKRAKNMFFGMRGRRDLGSEDMDEKRAYNAFFGMRGKRGYEDYLDEPSMHALYGMRGKKHRGRSNFFGMRGKKLPLEYRDKFVGVRGKKSTKTSDVVNAENEEENGIELQRVNSNDLGKLMFLFDDNKNRKQFDDDYNTVGQNPMTVID